jgi:hypothetical protein
MKAPLDETSQRITAHGEVEVGKPICMHNVGAQVLPEQDDPIEVRMRLSLNILDPFPDGLDHVSWQGDAKDTAVLPLVAVVCCSHMSLI